MNATSENSGSGAHERPLSPHLQIYRPQISSTLSILHRITGVALCLGLAMCTFYLFALAYNPDCLKTCTGKYNSLIIKIVLGGFSYALFFHLCTGIRHLFWDMGKGYEVKNMNATGWIAILASIVLTAGFWFLIMGGLKNGL